MGFAKAFAKMGLVKLEEKSPAEELVRQTVSSKPKSKSSFSDEDLERLMKGDFSAPAEPVVEQVEPVVITTTETPVEDTTFNEIYAKAEIPESTYPAEKLLKVIDGLGAMDANTRKTVIDAMDKADDSWTVADPLDDAKHKMIALQNFKSRLSTVAAEAEAKAQSDMQASDKYLQEATATIQQQLAELTAQLEQERQNVAQEKANIMATLQVKKDRCSKKQKELDAETGRLQKLLVLGQQPKP